MNLWRIASMAILLAACGGTDNLPDDTGPTGVEALTFTEIRDDILMPSCAFSSCHGMGAGGLTLAEDDPGAAYAALVNAMGDSGLTLVAPGDADGSYLIDKLEDSPNMVSGSAMPPGSSLLGTDPDAVAGIRAWINEGALDN